MKSRILWGVIVAASLSSAADAHFVLVQPAASLIQNRLGDPQKIGPCGGVSANPGRGTPANPGVPSGAITNVKGGTDLPLLVQESIFHPGHYRVALAQDDGAAAEGSRGDGRADGERTALAVGGHSESASRARPARRDLRPHRETGRATDLRWNDSHPEHHLSELRAPGDRVHGRPSWNCCRRWS